MYQNTGGAKFTLSNTDINKIDLQLYDEDFNYINFNNINWSILFCLYITYEMPAFTIPTQIDARILSEANPGKDKPIDVRILSDANLRNKVIDKPKDDPKKNDLNFLTS